MDEDWADLGGTRVYRVGMHEVEVQVSPSYARDKTEGVVVDIFGVQLDTRLYTSCSVRREGKQ
jgi:hypothetical protein